MRLDRMGGFELQVLEGVTGSPRCCQLALTLCPPAVERGQTLTKTSVGIAGYS